MRMITVAWLFVCCEAFAISSAKVLDGQNCPLQDDLAQTGEAQALRSGSESAGYGVNGPRIRWEVVRLQLSFQSGSAWPA